MKTLLKHTLISVQPRYLIINKLGAVYSSNIIENKWVKSVESEILNTEITRIITIRYSSIVEHRW